MSRESADPSDPLAAHVASEIARLLQRPLGAGLHIVATPIGNLGDITLRALAVLHRADVIYCEDTRHSRVLLAHFGLSARTRPYHEHNADHERPRIMERLAAGDRVALISDAGTPLISDPGFKLVRDAVAAGHAVHALPGACAAVAALTVAGLPTDCFLFAGFLPAKSGARRNRLKELSAHAATLVFYEAPNRVADSLADMLEVLGDRPCVIARELTKLHEEVRRGTMSVLRQDDTLANLKGEVVLLVGAAAAAEVSDAEIRTALAEAMASQSTRDAVRSVAERLALPRSHVYNIATLMERDE